MTAAEIAQALGGTSRSGQWWRCRCPVHNSRDATLALRDGDRRLIVKCFAGCDPRDILAVLRRLGLTRGLREPYQRVPPASAGQDVDSGSHPIAAAPRLWASARDSRGSPVQHYLVGRGITVPMPSSLRWVPRLPHPSGIWLPAMLAAIVDVAGELIGVHRTFLKPDGLGKADVDPPKAMLGRAAAGAVRLAEAGKTLLVGEGIETCLAGMQALGWPAWSALSTSGLVGLRLPALARDIIILADHDFNGAGERAARAAANRWLVEGRRVRIALPPVPGTDWNDVLLNKDLTEARDAA